MAKASDNKFPKVIMEEVATDGSATTTPTADHRSLFLGEDGALHLKDSAAAITDVASGIAATILDAKGDLIAASAADTAARLAAAANGASLITASSESTGLKWRLNNDGAAVAPAVTDDSGDGYSIGSRWLDTTADKEYVALDVSVGAAVWVETTATGGGSGAFIGCVATRTTDQTGIVDLTLTPVSFTGTDQLDTNAFHDPASNPDRMTIPTALDGVYQASTYLIWDTSAAGYRRIDLQKNGSSVQSQSDIAIAGGGTYSQQVVSFVPLALVATDYVSIVAYHNAGANRTLSGSVVSLKFGLTRLGS